MIDLRPFLIAANEVDDRAPELRCRDHDEWWADADAESLLTVIERAKEHIREAHRVHVADCMCQGAQVLDQRCIPQMSPP